MTGPRKQDSSDGGHRLSPHFSSTTSPTSMQDEIFHKMQSKEQQTKLKVNITELRQVLAVVIGLII